MLRTAIGLFVAAVEVAEVPATGRFATHWTAEALGQDGQAAAGAVDPTSLDQGRPALAQRPVHRAVCRSGPAPSTTQEISPEPLDGVVLAASLFTRDETVKSAIPAISIASARRLGAAASAVPDGHLRALRALGEKFFQGGVNKAF
jgi:hypothetical protein